MLTRQQNPSMQNPRQVALAEIPGTWWVGHTRPRQEKALARDIQAAGGGYFLPMQEVTRKSRGRQWKALLPLFAGYVFLCGDEDTRLAALRTNRVANVIDVPDQRRLIDQLTTLKDLLDQPGQVTTHPRLVKGARCRVRSGAMAGLEGVVQRRKNAARFVVNIEALGQCATLEIDGDLLEDLS